MNVMLAHTRTLLVVLIALALTGCPPTEELVPPPTTPQEQNDETAEHVALTQSCTNEAYGFSVDYPAGWITNEANGLPPCSAFDPEDVSMPEAGEIPADIAVVIHRQDVPVDRITDFEADFTVDVASRETTTVDGRNAVIAELEHTGDGLYPAGHRDYGYYIEVGDRTITGTTHDVGAASPPAYPERKRILDAMMRSLRIDSPG